MRPLAMLRESPSTLALLKPLAAAAADAPAGARTLDYLADLDAGPGGSLVGQGAGEVRLAAGAALSRSISVAWWQEEALTL